MESKKESIETKQNENRLTENNWVQRDQVEREVGGGTHVNPWLIHVNV